MLETCHIMNVWHSGDVLLAAIRASMGTAEASRAQATVRKSPKARVRMPLTSNTLINFSQHVVTTTHQFINCNLVQLILVLGVRGVCRS
ncbi:hypothetical protein BDY19DRAFT_956135 [Irpex rosettiformis]|uniref:Uncharacterized protein n=1 Tax=Irpex rosettiformis TaxID=378272 RepID=A0ACB8TYP9_9APHY|nr:hypothetical protein BDY19DRAFT_956135 [Irpex rosettiformis]